MPTRPMTAKTMHPRARGAVKRASMSRRGAGPRRAAIKLLDHLDAPDHFLQAGIGDELVVHRLHRVLEGLLLHGDDLRAGALDDLARLRLALVPQLPHE